MSLALEPSQTWRQTMHRKVGAKAILSTRSPLRVPQPGQVRCHPSTVIVGERRSALYRLSQQSDSRCPASHWECAQRGGTYRT
jgi:hypothetical protein